MAELKPLEVEVKSKSTLRPHHYLAAFMWINFYAVVWAWLLGYLPTGATTGSAVLIFLIFAILATTYGAGKR